LVLSKFTENISSQNITALTRLDQNRAYSQLANYFGVPTSAVKKRKNKKQKTKEYSFSK